MDITKEHVNPNPRDKANPLSILFFTYTIGMFKKGYSKTLDVDDLYSPIQSDRSKVLGDRLERKWNRHMESIKKSKKTKSPSLLKVLVSTFWPEYLYLGIILVFMALIVRLSQPLLLGKLLDYFRPASDVTKTEALWYAGAIVSLNALTALFINQYIMGALHYGMKVRAACCALIYRKALRLSRTTLADTASGKIVNLLSNDVSRFDMVSIFIHHMWVAPTAALIVTYFLYEGAGYAGIIGIIPVFLVMPIQSYTGKLSAIYRKKTALRTDERVRLMDEIINGVQVIKMYAWEKPFAKLIRLARKAELKVVTKSSYVRGLFMTLNLLTTRIALFCTLLATNLTNQQITAAKVFVFMSYYGILADTMSAMFVRGISEIAEVLVAIRRLQQFMVGEEKSQQLIAHNNNGTTVIQDKYTVSARNLTVKWNMESTDNALSDLNFNTTNQRLLGIIGPVGSGKSSLLQAILGELHIALGSLEVNGSISYASQDPWVFAATVRQNITFGLAYEKQRYNEVVHACCLEKDFKQFPEGDLTIVGDRGASLSGGQKARINLARAVYRNADIYLLDDPLSAVDVHVSKHLYEECINGYLRDKTRILVTHQVHHLKNADEIIIINNGSIENIGTFDLLSKSDTLYAQLLTSEPEQPSEEKQKQLEAAKLGRRVSTRSKASSLASAISDLSIPESILQEELQEEEEEIKLKDLQEESSKGKVRGSLFFKYLLAGSNICVVLLVVILYLLTQVAASGVDWFVSFWVNTEEARAAVTNTTSENVHISMLNLWSTDFCLYVYGGLIIALFVFALSRSMIFYKLAMLCSQKLHDQLFTYVINASMRFFDKNPSGRILNRFSKDIGAIDELLPKAILDAGQIILNMIGALVLVTTVNAYNLVLVGIIGVFFMLLRVVFLRSSKNIKRLEGRMRSPVFTHLNATIQGLTTIRAFGAQNVLRDEFDKHQDYHTSAWFMFIAASSAFGFYLDVLCFIFVTLVTFSFLWFGESFGLRGGEVGLAITQSMALTGLLQWGMRQSAEVANQLMSVERVLEYKELPREKQSENPKTPSVSWPEQGKICFKDMGLKYDDALPLVIRDLNITINPKEKVGIVGRTGAGKSSLIAALFRLANVVGDIEIDGYATSDLELHKLRSKISIIPQDPVLFSGTLRYNLDPFEKYPDEVLYRALNEVELKHPANLINRLENRVMDHGSNYSVGQRQLICLARAIIRNNKILMLDEATANVDPQTDAVIQKTIRALRLSKTALADTASGKIVNLLSNDVSRFDVVSIVIHHMWIAPTSALIITYFLYSKAGFAGIIGIAPLFLVVPLQSYTGRLSAIYRKQTASRTDERVRLMDEIITGVQVIKMYAWEIPFAKLIRLARKAELKIVTKSSYVRGLFMTFNVFTTRVALFCTLLAVVLSGQDITAANVFVFMAYYNILSQTMSGMFVRGISEVAEVLVAIRRLQQFMTNEEFIQDTDRYNTNIDKNENVNLSLKKVTAKWNEDSSDNALNDLNFTVDHGKLLGIIGPVGSGKSSLLQTILGELYIFSGEIKVNGTISYASQEPWVFAATIRQNITFGLEYDRNHYKEVIKVCALEHDFRLFPDGDLTIVGDRGASLSGGQKARINLARAVYRDADIYLLDDPLSAVDIHVSKHLYEQCINGFLANKIRILVTHQVHHLRNADEILILNNGSIEEKGTFDYLAKSGSYYAQLLTQPEHLEEQPKAPEPIIFQRQRSYGSRAPSLASVISNLSIIVEEEKEFTVKELQEESPKLKVKVKVKDMQEESSKLKVKVKVKDMQEESSKLKVSGSLLFKYFLSGSNICFAMIVIVLYVLTQVTGSGIDFFVSFWVNLEEGRRAVTNSTEVDITLPYELSTEMCMYIYGILIIVLFVIAISRSMLFYKLAMLSSQKLHDLLFKSVINASMGCFDTNPSGRILNRFAEDIGSIDELLPKTILDASQTILSMLGALTLVTVVNPYFLILVGILSIFFMLLRIIFLRSSKNIKRLEGMMRSPVFTHLNATLQGLTTIRAFNAQDILRNEFDKHQDYHTSAWFMFIAANSAFGFYLDMLCFVFVSLITFSFLTFGESLDLKGGEVGLAITQSTALTGLLQWGIRQSAEISNQLLSVERVLEYKQLPSENQPTNPKTPPKTWPNNGKITLRNMCLKYDVGNPLVIKDLNIVIAPKEKVGVVGRTGAGKSSLIAALFRLAHIIGDIEIDDIDTKDLELTDLRSKISIIPQDPVLFSGTLRYNLDPFEEYPDEVLYKALNDVELKDPANVINRLENRVMDRGSNYSVGQRQLICLARAIIRQNKILMLDEATANVDPQTDALIQKTIRDKFVDCTVLTVARRLNTIMDSDKVLVMENGTMVEFDHPHVLLQKHNGKFARMVAETGRATTDELRKVARASYQKRYTLPE